RRERQENEGGESDDRLRHGRPRFGSGGRDYSAGATGNAGVPAWVKSVDDSLLLGCLRWSGRFRKRCGDEGLPILRRHLLDAFELEAEAVPAGIVGKGNLDFLEPAALRVRPDRAGLPAD